jgi:hypothetical protein
MFAIELASSTNEVIDSVFYRKFRITLGLDEEFLLCPLCFWSIEDYKLHWRTQLNKFISNRADRTALITEMYDPETANFIKWWAIYRVGEEVAVQEQLVFMDELTSCFSLERLDEVMGEYKQINEDGYEISEWRFPLKQLEESPLLSESAS